MDRALMLVLLLAAVGCETEREPVLPEEEPFLPGEEPMLPGEEPMVPPRPVTPPPGAPLERDDAMGTNGLERDGAYGTNGEPGTAYPAAPVEPGAQAPGAVEGTIQPPETTQSPTPGTAQTQPPGTGQGPAADAREAVGQALADAHQVHVHEMALGRLALLKSQDPAIRSYAEQLLQDHTSADADLVQLTRVEGIALEAADQSRYQDQLEIVQRLRGLEGAEFNEAFVQEMIRSHDRGVDLVQTSMTTLEDPEVQAYFEQVLPILQDHLARARQLQPGVQGTE